MEGYRKLLAFVFTAILIAGLVLAGKSEGSGLEALVWAYGVFVTGNVGTAWSRRGNAPVA